MKTKIVKFTQVILVAVAMILIAITKKETIVEVEVIKEVPVEVEVIKEVEVVKEIKIPVEIVKEVEVPVEIIKEVEVIKEVPVEVIKEVHIPQYVYIAEGYEQQNEVEYDNYYAFPTLLGSE